MKIKPTYQPVLNGANAQQIVEEYAWMGRHAEVQGRFVVLHPFEPKRKRKPRPEPED